MARIYAKLIREGSMGVEEVPVRWRADVEALLGLGGNAEEAV